MNTVIDVGCARWGGDYSVERLLEMFRPDVLHGFDPVPTVSEAMPATAHAAPGGVTAIQLHRMAAWTYDGEIGYVKDGLTSHITDEPDAPRVRCIDLARFIAEQPEGPVVLKLDCEGAEIDLLEHLLTRMVTERLTRVLVEWHPWNEPKRRRAIERALKCPVEQWRW